MTETGREATEPLAAALDETGRYPDEHARFLRAIRSRNKKAHAAYSDDFHARIRTAEAVKSARIQEEAVLAHRVSEAARKRAYRARIREARMRDIPTT